MVARRTGRIALQKVVAAVRYATELRVLTEIAVNTRLIRAVAGVWCDRVVDIVALERGERTQQTEHAASRARDDVAMNPWIRTLAHDARPETSDIYRVVRNGGVCSPDKMNGGSEVIVEQIILDRDRIIAEAHLDTVSIVLKNVVLHRRARTGNADRPGKFLKTVILDHCMR